MSEVGHIAFFVPTLGMGGAERCFVRLANEFRDRGWNVDFVVTDATGPAAKLLHPTVSLVDLHVRRTMLAVPGLSGYLRKQRPDLLFATVPHASIVAAFSRRLSSHRPALVLRHSSDFRALAPTERDLGTRAMLTLLSRAYRSADLVVAVSRGAAEDAAKGFGVPDHALTQLPNPTVGPWLRKAMTENPSHPWLRSRESPVVITVGRLTAAKDHATLIRAFARLRATRPCKLLVYGEGPLRSQIQTDVDSLGLAADVDLPGNIANPYAEIAKSSLFVLSSVREGLPNVLIEALACGIPIVSTNCSTGPAEVLDDGRLGQLVPVGDPESLYQAMSRSLDQPPPGGMTDSALRFDVVQVVDELIAELRERRLLPARH